ncbi:hypothetical protein NQ176_g8365 [Zarea fungicola]|uniref:Uncharacterized protein n=1 Tax=Zarea fungicola TaxID=93591 RepID=A0ACC1MTQ2_9HYPO|nr:hypothetical protein NQ176_g8365 [Lecanicillium fungicola]
MSDIDVQEQRLDRRLQLTEGLISLPYDLVLYLERAVVYADLGYPDLAAGDAYRALLLTDEVLTDGFEFHEQAVAALRMHLPQPLPEVLSHGKLPAEWLSNDGADNEDDEDKSLQALARMCSIRAYQILSLSLLLCGCLKSALTFCERGLAACPDNQELLDTKNSIHAMARRRLRRDTFDINDLPDSGLVRREVYPWNDHEPDRFSDESLAALNADLKKMAPKCAIEVATLPVLLENASSTDSLDIIPTCKQLGVFAQEDIEPGEAVLREYTLLTANNRLKDSNGHASQSRSGPVPQNEMWQEQLRSHKECERAHSAMTDQQQPHYYARLKASENKGISGPPPSSGRTQPDGENELAERRRPWDVSDEITRQDWHNMDMSGQGLRNLAPALFKYQFLNELYIASNKLTKLPKQIGDLRQLRHLDVSYNQLTEVPAELGMFAFRAWLLARARSVESRRSGASTANITSTSGYERRKQNNRRGAIEGSKRRKTQVDDDDEGGGEWGGIDD